MPTLTTISPTDVEAFDLEALFDLDLKVVVADTLAEKAASTGPLCLSGSNCNRCNTGITCTVGCPTYGESCNSGGQTGHPCKCF